MNEKKKRVEDDFFLTYRQVGNHQRMDIRIDVSNMSRWKIKHKDMEVHVE